MIGVRVSGLRAFLSLPCHCVAFIQNSGQTVAPSDVEWSGVGGFLDDRARKQKKPILEANGLPKPRTKLETRTVGAAPHQIDWSYRKFCLSQSPKSSIPLVALVPKP